jgi:hypothetical protein
MVVTFKSRVEAFWEWFAANAARFYDTIEAGNCPELEPEVSAMLKKVLPGFAWVFGPGENDIGHSFTLSAEGDLHRQFLTSFWLDIAPQIAGWTFYGSRQPSVLNPDMTIEIADLKFSAGELLIDATVNKEQEKIDLKAWHPHFPTFHEQQQYSILFIFLDEALGETGTQSWIGEIEITDALSPKSVPVSDLKRLVDNVAKACEWEKLPPDQTYTLYQLPDPSNAFPRADTISGTTSNFQLLAEYLNAEGKIEDVLEGTGAEFLYLDIDPQIFPAGSEVETRGQIEDALDEALRSQLSGRIFGGAFGLSAAYIDLVIFDGKQSLQLVEETMDQLNLAERYNICQFAVPE